MAEEVLSDVAEVWNNASVPCESTKLSVRRLQKLIASYKAAKMKSTERMNKFKMECDLKLFGICACKCSESASCKCPLDRRVPLIERDFLNDQRNERKMVIGGVDKERTAANLRLITRKDKQNAFKEKAKPAAPPSSGKKRRVMSPLLPPLDQTLPPKRARKEPQPSTSTGDSGGDSGDDSDSAPAAEDPDYALTRWHAAQMRPPSSQTRLKLPSVALVVARTGVTKPGGDDPQRRLQRCGCSRGHVHVHQPTARL